MACTDNTLLHDSGVKVDEQKVSEIIDKVCNQPKGFQVDTTPDQIKMVDADSSIVRARGLDTDKENQQANKPTRRIARSRKIKVVDENEGAVNSFHLAAAGEPERKPFQPIENRPTKSFSVLHEIEKAQDKQVGKTFHDYMQSKQSQPSHSKAKQVFTPPKNAAAARTQPSLGLKPASSLGDSVLSDKTGGAGDSSSTKERAQAKCHAAMNNWYLAMGNFAAAAAAHHHLHPAMTQQSFFHHLSNLSFMSHLNFKANENKDKSHVYLHQSNMKPSSFLSAKSKKIGSYMNLSTEKKADSNNSETSHKHGVNGKGRDKNGIMSTPKMKHVTGFSLNNAGGLLAGLTGRVEQSNSTLKSNIKMPIASYNMPKELLFNSHSDNKAGFIRSCESKKSIAQPFGNNNLSNLMQFGGQSPRQKDEDESPTANREQPQSLADLCGNMNLNRQGLMLQAESSGFTKRAGGVGEAPRRSATGMFGTNFYNKMVDGRDGDDEYLDPKTSMMEVDIIPSKSFEKQQERS